VSCWLLSAPFLAAEEPRLLVRHEGWVRTVACSPDGKIVASGGENGVILLQQCDGSEQPVVLDANEGWVQRLAFSPDGKRLAACYCLTMEGGRRNPPFLSEEERWRANYSLLVWDLDRRRPYATLERRSPRGISGVAFSPDGRSLGATSGQNLILWEMATGKQRAVCQRAATGAPWDFVTDVAFAPDGRRLASRACLEDMIRIWDVATQKQAFALPCPGAKGGHLAFSPGGRVLVAVVGSEEKDQRGKLQVWDLTGRKSVRTIAAHDGQVLCLAISPDGKMVASGGGDNRVRLWERATGKELACLRGQDIVSSVTFAQNGSSLIAGSRDGTVRRWAPAALKRRER
jgi:WD40 repeat protein